MCADGRTKREVFEVELENVLLGAVVPNVMGGGILSEYVSLKFSKVKRKYAQQKIAGGMGGNTTGGWDLSTNRIC
jgi:type VI secretion system secreted protein Hcp